MGYMDGVKRINHGVVNSGEVKIVPGRDILNVIAATGGHTWDIDNFSDEEPEGTLIVGIKQTMNIAFSAYGALATDSDLASTSNIPAGKYLVKFYSYAERILFSATGTDPIYVGDTVTGPAGSAFVIAVVLTSGSWAGGDAVGYLDVINVVGTFAATSALLVSEAQKALTAFQISRGYDVFISTVGAG